jgi:hypothetical protein
MTKDSSVRTRVDQKRFSSLPPIAVVPFLILHVVSFLLWIEQNQKDVLVSVKRE